MIHKYKAWDMNCMLGPRGLLLKDTPEWLSNLTSEAILLQFTGLKDRNGKDIYEGDIYKEGKRLRVVVFSSGGFMGDHANGASQVFISHYDIEIIGNIYESPHLLK